MEYYHSGMFHTLCGRLEMLTTVYETRKNNLLLMLKYYENRRVFSEKINIEYNMLNQYLGQKNPKNIGDKLAAKITESHHLPTGWLDHTHDELTIKNIIESQSTTNHVAIDTLNQNLSTNHPSIEQSDQLRMVALTNILKMSKGEDLEVNSNVQEIKNISIPNGLKNPVAYIIKGLGFSKPYRNGYVIVTEFTGKPIPGEETLIFCKDGRIFAGEYLFEQDILISIDSVTGEKENILKEDIARISPIILFISPSQIL